MQMDYMNPKKKRFEMNGTAKTFQMDGYKLIPVF